MICDYCHQLCDGKYSFAECTLCKVEWYDEPCKTVFTYDAINLSDIKINYRFVIMDDYSLLIKIISKPLLGTFSSDPIFKVNQKLDINPFNLKEKIETILLYL